jgi:hypothetical protein
LDWFFSLSIPAMTVMVFAGMYLLTAVIYLLVTRLAVGERLRTFKAISPGMLPPLAVVLALLVGFLAAQVWSDMDRAATTVNREASALRAAVLLSDEFPGGADAQLRDLVRQHVHTAVTEEWPAMSRRGATLTLVPVALAKALKLALSLDPHTPGQVIAQRELVAAIQNAFDARRQRVVLSASSVNTVKWAALLVEAALMLLAIAMVHCDNPATNRLILGIFVTGVAAAFLLIASHSRPFTGAISVRPTVLEQVMPEAGAR